MSQERTQMKLEKVLAIVAIIDDGELDCLDVITILNAAGTLAGVPMRVVRTDQ